MNKLLDLRRLIADDAYANVRCQLGGTCCRTAGMDAPGEGQQR